MNSIQERVIKLLDEATPKEKLKKWVKGYIPEHYKRLSVSMEEAERIAEIGAIEAYAYFGTRLYFTQALLMGAVVEGHYKKFIVVTPSQYGKSWLCGQIAIWLGDQGQTTYVAGVDADTTGIILDKAMEHIQNVDTSVKNKLLESADKIERLQTAVSKKRLAWKGGGMVEGISLGENFKDAKRGNKAIGRGANYIIDEASLVSDDTYAEMGRREFANKDGGQYISIEISNPHNPGRFWEALTADETPGNTLVIWMDARTACEEGNFRHTKEEIIRSDFFINKSTCKRYLLCELEDYSAESLFAEPIIDDTEPEDCMYFLGVDSAYKGKDDIKVALTGLTVNGTLRILDMVTIDKTNWVDGKTSEKIIKDIMRIARGFGVKKICVDVGYGVYIVEALSQRADTFSVNGINFGSGTTKGRKQFSAVYGDNKRAEMHLDLQDLMDNFKVTFTTDMAEGLKEQMGAVKAIRKPNGKTAIIPKDEIKQIIGRSPDDLDAVLLSVHAAILYLMSESTLLYQDE